MSLIDEARKLLKAATPGPWEVRQDCEYWDVYPPGSIHPIGDGPDETCFEADARLIAFLRNNAARLCDALEATTQERDQARAEVERLRKALHDATHCIHGAPFSERCLDCQASDGGEREDDPAECWCGAVIDDIGMCVYDVSHDPARGTTEGGQGG